MNFIYIEYIRAILYLLSIYSVISNGIVYIQKDKRVFWIHFLVAMLLLINFLGVLLVRILFFEWAEIILFEYGMTVVLIAINILVWGRLFSRNADENNVKDSINALYEKLSMKKDSIDSASKSLYDLV